MSEPVINIPDAISEDGLPVVESTLPRSSFPFRMRILDAETREGLWEHICRGVGPVRVPGFAPRVVLAEMTFANGQQYIDGPGGFHEEKWVDPIRF